MLMARPGGGPCPPSTTTMAFATMVRNTPALKTGLDAAHGARLASRIAAHAMEPSSPPWSSKHKQLARVECSSQNAYGCGLLLLLLVLFSLPATLDGGAVHTVTPSWPALCDWDSSQAKRRALHGALTVH